jgi:hypothetical protein
MVDLCPKVKWSSIQMASEYRKNMSGCQWSISLAFVLWSENRSGFEWLKQDGRFYHSKARHKLCPENDHLNTGLSGFQMVTVFLLIRWFRPVQNLAVALFKTIQYLEKISLIMV